VFRAQKRWHWPHIYSLFIQLQMNKEYMYESSVMSLHTKPPAPLNLEGTHLVTAASIFAVEDLSVSLAG